jgi:hypothetical protein
MNPRTILALALMALLAGCTASAPQANVAIDKVALDSMLCLSNGNTLATGQFVVWNGGPAPAADIAVRWHTTKDGEPTPGVFEADPIPALPVDSRREYIIAGWGLTQCPEANAGPTFEKLSGVLTISPSNGPEVEVGFTFLCLWSTDSSGNATSCRS